MNNNKEIKTKVIKFLNKIPSDLIDIKILEDNKYLLDDKITTKDNFIQQLLKYKKIEIYGMNENEIYFKIYDKELTIQIYEAELEQDIDFGVKEEEKYYEGFNYNN